MHGSMKKIAAVFCLLILSAACTGSGVTTTQTGAGPVVMSPAAYASYLAYQDKVDPLIFALSQDGKHAYWVNCLDIKKDCDVERYAQMAIDRCTTRGGSRCYIFARRKAVIWRNAGEWQPATTS